LCQPRLLGRLERRRERCLLFLAKALLGEAHVRLAALEDGARLMGEALSSNQ
jgi:hypothetical protein